MIPKSFLHQLDDDRIVAAIAAAEANTSGEIRVFVSDAQPADPVAAAKIYFEKMEMTKTRDRNGVLIFVAPLSRNFAVIGDEAVNSKCGEGFWRHIADDMTNYFKSGRFTDGIVYAITEVGAVLSQHFPRRTDDVNELPDKVERG
jgi:uncharacterized membrane protein